MKPTTPIMTLTFAIVAVILLTGAINIPYLKYHNPLNVFALGCSIILATLVLLLGLHDCRVIRKRGKC